MKPKDILTRASDDYIKSNGTANVIKTSSLAMKSYQLNNSIPPTILETRRFKSPLNIKNIWTDILPAIVNNNSSGAATDQRAHHSIPADHLEKVIL